MLDYVIHASEVLGTFAIITSLAMLNSTTRKVAYALMRYGKRHAPKWAIVLMVLPIPGPLDEIAAIVGIAWTFRNARNRQIFKRYLARALA